MKHIDILNDRITVNQINGKTEAVAALREVREAMLKADADELRWDDRNIIPKAVADAAGLVMRWAYANLGVRWELWGLAARKLVHELREDVKELEAGLQLGKIHFDEAYDELTSERDAALAEVARLKATTVPVEMEIVRSREYGDWNGAVYAGHAMVWVGDAPTNLECKSLIEEYIANMHLAAEIRATMHSKDKEAQGCPVCGAESLPLSQNDRASGYSLWKCGSRKLGDFRQSKTCKEAQG